MKSESKERGILFSGSLIGPLLRGEKTVTRRLVKPQPEPMPDDVPRVASDTGWWWSCSAAKSMVQIREMSSFCPYGSRGDRLWVRETWGIRECGSRVSLSAETWPEGWPVDRLFYVADGNAPTFGRRVSIHMPRWASRITLEITDVRPERLHEITEEDARAEGVVPISGGETPHLYAFAQKWDELHGAGSWSANPFVWRIAFKRTPTTRSAP